MTTPEEIAKQVHDQYFPNEVCDENCSFIQSIAAALRAERERTKEAAAQVAKSYQDIIDDARRKAGYANSPDIAAAIMGLT